jgi:hypothetical protein
MSDYSYWRPPAATRRIMRRAERLRTILIALVLVMVAVGPPLGLFLTASHSSRTHSEQVGALTYAMCQKAIDGTSAQVRALPADQRHELLSVAAWCQSLAIRTDHGGPK